MRQLTVVSGFGVMPLQLLNLGVLIPRMIFRIFSTRTPRGTYDSYTFVLQL